MTKPVTKAETLVTDDGVRIEAVHLPGDRSLGFVVAHGFTQDWHAPGVRKVALRLSRFGGVIVFDFRGHGRSGGRSTLGDREINDLEVAIRYARELGYQRIVSVGFSMGASIVLRHTALIGGSDGVVSVSCPGRWYYRETLPMRRVHFAVEHKLGRLAAKTFLNTRISHGRWDPVPMPPAEAAARVAPTPLLVVHGDRDNFFPVEHAEQLFEAASQPKELWIVPGFTHAESGASHALLDRIGRWAQVAAVATASVGGAGPGGNGAVPSAASAAGADGAAPSAASAAGADGATPSAASAAGANGAAPSAASPGAAGAGANGAAPSAASPNAAR